MTVGTAPRALGATIHRLADYQRKPEAQTYLDVPELRHLAPPAEIHSTRYGNRFRIACMALITVALLGAAALENAVTARIAASLATDITPEALNP